MKKLVWVFLLLCFRFPAVTAAYTQKSIFLHNYGYKLSDVLDAENFVEKKGYWEGYRSGRKVGYVFLSQNWTKNILGYSGRHMETLVGMDTRGVISDVKLISHSEPIVLIGLKEANYQKFLMQYRDKDITEDLTVGGKISLDAIAGATVTAVVQNAIIIRSSRQVALQAGIIQPAGGGSARRLNRKVLSLSWKELLQKDAVKKLIVASADLGMNQATPYLELYFGLATVPSIGQNVLGQQGFREMTAALRKEESALFIFSRGAGSFKGSGFARGGVFDRFHLTQGQEAYFFKEADYKILTDIKARGAPAVQEGGIFFVRNQGFDPAAPFKFNFILPYYRSGQKEFKSFKIDYQTPDLFLE